MCVRRAHEGCAGGAGDLEVVRIAPGADDQPVVFLAAYCVADSSPRHSACTPCAYACRTGVQQIWRRAKAGGCMVFEPRFGMKRRDPAGDLSLRAVALRRRL